MDLTHDPDVAYDIVTQHQRRLRDEAAAEQAVSAAGRSWPRLDLGRSRRRLAGVLRHLADLVETSSFEPRSVSH